MVVLSIAFLARFLFFPRIHGHGTAPPRAHVVRLAIALEMATRDYRSEYGRFPIQGGPASDDHAFVTNHVPLVAALRGTDRVANPRQIPFLDVSPRFLDAAGHLIDSWRQPVHLVIDLNGDGQVLVGTNRVAWPVAVWSSGPNRVDEQGGGDDLTSW